MAGKGDGEGEGNILKLENQIAVIKYVMLFTNAIEWVSDLVYNRFRAGWARWQTSYASYDKVG